MKSAYKKFKWWTKQIEKEEAKLTYRLTKIFSSYKMLFDLFDGENIVLDGYNDLKNLVENFSLADSFTENVKCFSEVFRKSEDYGIFKTHVKNLETLERMRKTQYHIWKLFEDSLSYNSLVRKYNNRRNMPGRYLAAGLGKFEEKPFLFENQCYHSPDSVRIIGICGASGSGKSTACKAFSRYYSFPVIHLDHFFRKNPGGTCEGYDNWETESSLDLHKLAICLSQLKQGEPTLIPSAGWTEKFDTLIYPSPVILIEGFLLFTDEKINSLLDYKIFIDLSEENMLLRRTQREGHDNLDYIWKCVIPQYKKRREILLKKADLVLDGNKTENEVKNALKKEISNYLEKTQAAPSSQRNRCQVAPSSRDSSSN